MKDFFAHMRPYLDHEVPEAIEHLVEALDWESELGPFIGNDRAANLIEGLRSLQSVEAFQENLSRVFIDLLLQQTAEDVSVSFSPGFEGHGALFISNHRDIVLDPSLINMALLSCGESTTQIGIGSNLLQTEWVEKLVRLNKSFIVRRGGTPREQLMASAEVAKYVRHVITEQNASVWLAQREGRAKDGDDRTSPALIRMLLNGENESAWNRMKVQPVSLSYEWDPCDGMKVRELLIRDANNGEYAKASGEDERSMKQGLFGWKGRIHVAFCNPIVWEEPPEGVRDAVHLAARLDQVLHEAMRTWPCQHWAASEWLRIMDHHGQNWPEDWSPNAVDSSVGESCERRIRLIAESVKDLNVSEEALRLKWCEITMNPLINAVLAERASSVTV
ncbi:MAG: hypothetical protein CL845_09240 [Crocinitomicaceae bacterium]|nr:hypothetical protein [Crocinitomicaceae bacterium]